MVAALVADPNALPFAQMKRWAADLDSWDVTDMLADTFASGRHADRAIHDWSRARTRIHQAVRLRDDRPPRRRPATGPTPRSEICSR